MPNGTNLLTTAAIFINYQTSSKLCSSCVVEYVDAVAVGNILPAEFQELKLQCGEILQFAEATVTNQEHPWDTRMNSYTQLTTHAKAAPLAQISSCGLERNKGQLSGKGKNKPHRNHRVSP